MRAEGAGAGEIMLSDALHIAPDHPTLLGLRGDLAFQRGAYADAAADYRRQFETTPDNVAARLALAEALIAAGDHAQANALLDAFLAERPGNGPANYLRAAAAFQEGDAEAVQEHRSAPWTPCPRMCRACSCSGPAAMRSVVWNMRARISRRCWPGNPIMRRAAAAGRDRSAARPGQAEPRRPARAGERCSGSTLPPCRALRRSRTRPARRRGGGRSASRARAITTAAAEILAELESAAPDSPALLELRGGLALLAGRPSAAARAFEAAQQTRPAGVLARKLAFAQWQAGQRATSQATLEAWLTRAPTISRPS